MAPIKWKTGGNGKIEFFRKMFCKSGYPSTVFNKTVDKFLSNRDHMKAVTKLKMIQNSFIKCLSLAIFLHEKWLD